MPQQPLKRRLQKILACIPAAGEQHRRSLEMLATPGEEFLKPAHTAVNSHPFPPVQSPPSTNRAEKTLTPVRTGPGKLTWRALPCEVTQPSRRKMNGRGRDRPCGRPPRRSQRAELPHWAPTSGVWRRSAPPGRGASRGRVVATGGDPVHPFPGDPGFLAAAPQPDACAWPSGLRRLRNISAVPGQLSRSPAAGPSHRRLASVP
jgi:hypothetical protein